MVRKTSVPDAMESSDDEESGSESSEEDEFDSADERVNQVPSKTLTLTTQEESSDHTDSSDDSDSESDEKPIDLSLKSAGSETLKTQPQQNEGASEILEAVKFFDSDGESSSESEDLTQKAPPAQDRKDMASGSAIKAVESLPVGQKQGQRDDLPAKKGKVEDYHSIEQGKGVQKDPPLATKGKHIGLKQMQEENHPVKKGKGKALKQVHIEDQPMKKEEEEDHPATESKVESLKRDREVDSDAKESARKRRKDSAVADSKHKGDGNQEKSHAAVAFKDGHSSKEGHEKAMSNQDGDRKAAGRVKPAHDSSHDAGKEIARKAKSDPTGRSNGSGDGPDRKVSKAEHDGKHEKKAHNNAVKELPMPKQKKLPHVWSPAEEIVMASELLNHVKLGMEIPKNRNDDFWVTLSETLQGKLDVNFSKEQLCEKARRMKLRYRTLVHKVKESEDAHKPYKHRSASDQSLFDLWSQIWGRAEVTSLEDKEGTSAVAAANIREEPAKPVGAIANPLREGKSAHTKKGLDVHKSRLSPETKVSEKDDGSDVDENVGREALEGNRIPTMPMELDNKEVSQGNGSHKAPSNITHLPILASPSSPADGKFGHFPSDVHKFLQDEIQAFLHEFQESSKKSWEEWMSKAMPLIENAVKTLADQTRHMNGMGLGLTTAGGLSCRSWDLMDVQFLHGEQAFQQQWYELHLQELNVYAQRLQLMQKECELQQEQLKLHLQLERGKQS